MKTTMTAHIGLALLLGAGLALGAPTPSPRPEINPGLLYYQAFLLAPEPMPEADLEFLYSREGRGQKLPERFGERFAAYDNQFKLVRQAARSTAPCNWGIDLSDGPNVLLPHLARTKAVAQATRLRVMWQLQQGKPAEASEDWLAAMALARRVASDGTMIATLVQTASEAISCETLAENFGRFPSETLKTLVAGLDNLPARGTVAGSITQEKVICHDWALGKILALQQQYAGNDAKVMEAIHEFLKVSEGESEETNLWTRLSSAAGGTSDGVVRLFREREGFYDRLTAALSLPFAEYQPRAAELSAEIAQSSNPLAGLSFPGFLKARNREFRMNVWLAAIHAAVEYRLHGEAGLQRVMDPCGTGPFACQRFEFEGVDRGFQLTSAYTGSGFPEAIIFIEKEGPAFRVNGPYVGQAVKDVKK